VNDDLGKALLRTSQEQIAAIRRDREQLLAQIRESQETIARSQALVKRIDDLLTKIGEKP
jgi:hypothetical protein